MQRTFVCVECARLGVESKYIAKPRGPLPRLCDRHRPASRANSEALLIEIDGGWVLREGVAYAHRHGLVDYRLKPGLVTKSLRQLCNGRTSRIIKDAEMRYRRACRGSRAKVAWALLAAEIESRSKLVSMALTTAHDSRVRVVVSIFMTLFDACALRMWIHLGPAGAEIRAELPGDTASWMDVAFKAAVLCEQHGIIDESFFLRLSEVRPARQHELCALATLLLRT